jgi:hypothetical protein
MRPCCRAEGSLDCRVLEPDVERRREVGRVRGCANAEAMRKSALEGAIVTEINAVVSRLVYVLLSAYCTA